MKSINELYQEVKSDENLRNEFLKAMAANDIEGFLKKSGCDATAEDVQKFIEQELRPGTRELSDEELALVAGGKGDGDFKYNVGQRVEYVRIDHNDDNTYTGQIINRYKNNFKENLYEIRCDQYGGKDNAKENRVKPI